MKAGRILATMLAMAIGATARGAEPNESFAAATVLNPGVLTVADELTPPVVGFPDTLLGVRDAAGFLSDFNDDGGPFAATYGSGLQFVPITSGTIDFTVTGVGDFGFVGDHSEFGNFRVVIEVYDFFDDLVDTITADRTLQPGVAHDFYYEDFSWIGGSYDVYTDNTVGGAASDVDFFTFTGLTAGAAFTAQTADPEMWDVDTVLGWFDDGGSLVELDDDGAGGVLSLIEGIVPASGTLTFAVSGYGDDEFLGEHAEEGTYELQVTLGGGFAADFDNSGGVRAADLALWQANYGPSAIGDADGDNDTDGADFLIWQRELGSGVGAAAVPEPGSATLVAFALLCHAVSLRRR